METGHRSEISNHSMMHPEFIVDEVDLLNPSKKSGSSSPSSSSDSSFDEDFFHIDGDEPSKSKEGVTNPPELDNDAQLASTDVGKVIPSISSPKSEASGLVSPGATSPPNVSGISPETIWSSNSVTQSPPVQVMGRTDDSGSYRIPSSVFARSKSTTPLEWSVASNESLFSIHVGNNSFSRDNVLVYRSGELGKSGELVFPLTKSGELIVPRMNSGELMNFQNIPPTRMTMLDSDKKSLDSEESIGVTEAAAETMKEVLRVTAEDRNKEKTPANAAPHSPSVSHHSDGSGTSIQSFAFPIRKKKRAWPFCYCFNGRWAFCYCRWPSCCCRNGSWAFCYCSNCSSNCSWVFCSCSNCCYNPCLKCCSNPCSNCCGNPCRSRCSGNCCSGNCCSNPCRSCCSGNCCSNPFRNCCSGNCFSNPFRNCCSGNCFSNPFRNCCSGNCFSNPCHSCCNGNCCSNPFRNCCSGKCCSNPCGNCYSRNFCSNPCGNCCSNPFLNCL